MSELLAFADTHPITVCFALWCASRLFHFVRHETNVKVKLRPERQADEE